MGTVPRMRRRARLAEWLDRAKILDAALFVRAHAPSPWVTVLTYHSVRGAPGGFDSGVIDATGKQLDAQLALVRRHGSPISLDDLRGFVLEGRALPDRPVLVTFDDGYRDNHDVALPLLVRHGIPATFFVSTSYVTERRVFWWDRIAYLITRSEEPRLHIDSPLQLDLDLRDRVSAIHKAQRAVKDTRDLDVDAFLRALGDAAKVTWSDAEERRYADELVLTWEQVRAMRRAGMTVASHTCTHRVLHTLSEEQLARELACSREALEGALDEPVYAVSYPVGRTISDRPAIRRAVAAAGYELGFSNATGINNTWQGLDPLDLRRVSLDLDLEDVLFRAMLAIPPLGPT